MLNSIPPEGYRSLLHQETRGIVQLNINHHINTENARVRKKRKRNMMKYSGMRLNFSYGIYKIPNQIIMHVIVQGDLF